MSQIASTVPSWRSPGYSEPSSSFSRTGMTSTSFSSFAGTTPQQFNLNSSMLNRTNSIISTLPSYSSYYLNRTLSTPEGHRQNLSAINSSMVYDGKPSNLRNERNGSLIKEEIYDVEVIDHFPTLIELYGERPKVYRQGDCEVREEVVFVEDDPIVTEDIVCELVYVDGVCKHTRTLRRSRSEKRMFKKMRKRSVRRVASTAPQQRSSHEGNDDASSKSYYHTYYRDCNAKDNEHRYVELAAPIATLTPLPDTPYRQQVKPFETKKSTPQMPMSKLAISDVAPTETATQYGICTHLAKRKDIQSFSSRQDERIKTHSDRSMIPSNSNAPQLQSQVPPPRYSHISNREFDQRGGSLSYSRPFNEGNRYAIPTIRSTSSDLSTSSKSNTSSYIEPNQDSFWRGIDTVQTDVGIADSFMKFGKKESVSSEIHPISIHAVSTRLPEPNDSIGMQGNDSEPKIKSPAKVDTASADSSLIESDFYECISEEGGAEKMAQELFPPQIYMHLKDISKDKVVDADVAKESIDHGSSVDEAINWHDKVVQPESTLLQDSFTKPVDITIRSVTTDFHTSGIEAILHWHTDCKNTKRLFAVSSSKKYTSSILEFSLPLSTPINDVCREIDEHVEREDYGMQTGSQDVEPYLEFSSMPLSDTQLNRQKLEPMERNDNKEEIENAKESVVTIVGWHIEPTRNIPEFSLRNEPLETGVSISSETEDLSRRPGVSRILNWHLNENAKFGDVMSTETISQAESPYTSHEKATHSHSESIGTIVEWHLLRDPRDDPSISVQPITDESIARENLETLYLPFDGSSLQNIKITAEVSDQLPPKDQMDESSTPEVKYISSGNMDFTDDGRHRPEWPIESVSSEIPSDGISGTSGIGLDDILPLTEDNTFQEKNELDTKQFEEEMNLDSYKRIAEREGNEARHFTPPLAVRMDDADGYDAAADLSTLITDIIHKDFSEYRGASTASDGNKDQISEHLSYPFTRQNEQIDTRLSLEMMGAGSEGSLYTPFTAGSMDEKEVGTKDVFLASEEKSTALEDANQISGSTQSPNQKGMPKNDEDYSITTDSQTEKLKQQEHKVETVTLSKLEKSPEERDLDVSAEYKFSLYSDAISSPVFGMVGIEIGEQLDYSNAQPEFIEELNDNNLGEMPGLHQEGISEPPVENLQHRATCINKMQDATEIPSPIIPSTTSREQHSTSRMETQIQKPEDDLSTQTQPTKMYGVHVDQERKMDKIQTPSQLIDNLSALIKDVIAVNEDAQANFPLAAAVDISEQDLPLITQSHLASPFELTSSTKRDGDLEDSRLDASRKEVLVSEMIQPEKSPKISTIPVPIEGHAETTIPKTDKCIASLYKNESAYIRAVPSAEVEEEELEQKTDLCASSSQPDQNSKEIMDKQHKYTIEVNIAESSIISADNAGKHEVSDNRESASFDVKDESLSYPLDKPSTATADKLASLMDKEVKDSGEIEKELKKDDEDWTMLAEETTSPSDGIPSLIKEIIRAQSDLQSDATDKKLVDVKDESFSYPLDKPSTATADKLASLMDKEDKDSGEIERELKKDDKDWTALAEEMAVSCDGTPSLIQEIIRPQGDLQLDSTDRSLVDVKDESLSLPLDKPSTATADKLASLMDKEVKDSGEIEKELKKDDEDLTALKDEVTLPCDGIPSLIQEIIRAQGELQSDSTDRSLVDVKDESLSYTLDKTSTVTANKVASLMDKEVKDSVETERGSEEDDEDWTMLAEKTIVPSGGLPSLIQEIIRAQNDLQSDSTDRSLVDVKDESLSLPLDKASTVTAYKLASLMDKDVKDSGETEKGSKKDDEDLTALKDEVTMPCDGIPSLIQEIIRAQSDLQSDATDRSLVDVKDESLSLPLDKASTVTADKLASLMDKEVKDFGEIEKELTKDDEDFTALKDEATLPYDGIPSLIQEIIRAQSDLQSDATDRSLVDVKDESLSLPLDKASAVTADKLASLMDKEVKDSGETEKGSKKDDEDLTALKDEVTLPCDGIPSLIQEIIRAQSDLQSDATDRSLVDVKDESLSYPLDKTSTATADKLVSLMDKEVKDSVETERGSEEDDEDWTALAEETTVPCGGLPSLIQEIIRAQSDLQSDATDKKLVDVKDESLSYPLDKPSTATADKLASLMDKQVKDSGEIEKELKKDDKDWTMLAEGTTMPSDGIPSLIQEIIRAKSDLQSDATDKKLVDVKDESLSYPLDKPSTVTANKVASLMDKEVKDSGETEKGSKEDDEDWTALTEETTVPCGGLPSLIQEIIRAQSDLQSDATDRSLVDVKDESLSLPLDKASTVTADKLASLMDKEVKDSGEIEKELKKDDEDLTALKDEVTLPCDGTPSLIQEIIRAQSDLQSDATDRSLVDVKDESFSLPLDKASTVTANKLTSLMDKEVKDSVETERRSEEDDEDWTMLAEETIVPSDGIPSLIQEIIRDQGDLQSDVTDRNLEAKNYSDIFPDNLTYIIREIVDIPSSKSSSVAVTYRSSNEEIDEVSPGQSQVVDSKDSPISSIILSHLPLAVQSAIANHSRAVDDVHVPIEPAKTNLVIQEHVVVPSEEEIAPSDKLSSIINEIMKIDYRDRVETSTPHVATPDQSKMVEIKESKAFEHAESERLSNLSSLMDDILKCQIRDPVESVKMDSVDGKDNKQPFIDIEEPSGIVFGLSEDSSLSSKEPKFTTAKDETDGRDSVHSYASSTAPFLSAITGGVKAIRGSSSHDDSQKARIDEIIEDSMEVNVVQPATDRAYSIEEYRKLSGDGQNKSDYHITQIECPSGHIGAIMCSESPHADQLSPLGETKMAETEYSGISSIIKAQATALINSAEKFDSLPGNDGPISVKETVNDNNRKLEDDTTTVSMPTLEPEKSMKAEDHPPTIVEDRDPGLSEPFGGNLFRIMKEVTVASESSMTKPIPCVDYKPESSKRESELDVSKEIQEQVDIKDKSSLIESIITWHVSAMMPSDEDAPPNSSVLRNDAANIDDCKDFTEHDSSMVLTPCQNFETLDTFGAKEGNLAIVSEEFLDSRGLPFIGHSIVLTDTEFKKSESPSSRNIIEEIVLFHTLGNVSESASLYEKEVESAQTEKELGIATDNEATTLKEAELGTKEALEDPGVRESNSLASIIKEANSRTIPESSELCDTCDDERIDAQIQSPALPGVLVQDVFPPPIFESCTPNEQSVQYREQYYEMYARNSNIECSFNGGLVSQRRADEFVGDWRPVRDMILTGSETRSQVEEEDNFDYSSVSSTSVHMPASTGEEVESRSFDKIEPLYTSPFDRYSLVFGTKPKEFVDLQQRLVEDVNKFGHLKNEQSLIPHDDMKHRTFTSTSSYDLDSYHEPFFSETYRPSCDERIYALNLAETTSSDAYLSQSSYDLSARGHSPYYSPDTTAIKIADEDVHSLSFTSGASEMSDPHSSVASIIIDEALIAAVNQANRPSGVCMDTLQDELETNNAKLENLIKVAGETLNKDKTDREVSHDSQLTKELLYKADGAYKDLLSKVVSLNRDLSEQPSDENDAHDDKIINQSSTAVEQSASDVGEEIIDEQSASRSLDSKATEQQNFESTVDTMHDILKDRKEDDKSIEHLLIDIPDYVTSLASQSHPIHSYKEIIQARAKTIWERDSSEKEPELDYKEPPQPFPDNTRPADDNKACTTKKEPVTRRPVRSLSEDTSVSSILVDIMRTTLFGDPYIPKLSSSTTLSEKISLDNDEMDILETRIDTLTKEMNKELNREKTSHGSKKTSTDSRKRKSAGPSQHNVSSSKVAQDVKKKISPTTIQSQTRRPAPTTITATATQASSGMQHEPSITRITSPSQCPPVKSTTTTTTTATETAIHIHADGVPPAATRLSHHQPSSSSPPPPPPRPPQVTSTRKGHSAKSSQLVSASKTLIEGKEEANVRHELRTTVEKAPIEQIEEKMSRLLPSYVRIDKTNRQRRVTETDPAACDVEAPVSSASSNILDRLVLRPGNGNESEQNSDGKDSTSWKGSRSVRHRK
ncbi:hypothetical protein ACOME3_009439 [Neoechinorhynchus agilis]